MMLQHLLVSIASCLKINSPRLEHLDILHVFTDYYSNMFLPDIFLDDLLVSEDIVQLLLLVYQAHVQLPSCPLVTDVFICQES